MNKKRIILIDAGFLLHRAIYSRNALLRRKQELEKQGKTEEARKLFIMPSSYTFLTMLISVLKKVGITPIDKVLICCDGRFSWRKQYEEAYKENRKEIRAKATFVDWKKEFNLMDGVLEKINSNTPFFVLKANNLEADDWIAEATKFYEDLETIIISSDSDFLQLLVRDNVRIFSNHPKAKRIPYRILDLDREKEKKKAYKSLMKKVRKEVSDNLTSEVLTEQDYDNRLKIVSLLQLPDFVSKRIRDVLYAIEGIDKDFNLPVFSPSIQKRFKSLYKGDKVITYENCRVKLERKKRRKNARNRYNKSR
jgi:5'-3' exonuclease